VDVLVDILVEVSVRSVNSGTGSKHDRVCNRPAALHWPTALAWRGKTRARNASTLPTKLKYKIHHRTPQYEYSNHQWLVAVSLVSLVVSCTLHCSPLLFPFFPDKPPQST
jgi:hypothetical protein